MPRALPQVADLAAAAPGYAPRSGTRRARLLARFLLSAAAATRPSAPPDSARCLCSTTELQAPSAMWST